MVDEFGDDAGLSPLTANARGWPCLRQFSVFMENRVGRLHELFQRLERYDLRVIAMSVLDSADFSTVRVIVNDADRARELFKLSNFTTIETDVLGVMLPDDDKPLLHVCLALLEAELNIQYMYPLLYRRGRQGSIAMCVDDIDLATRTFEKKGHQLLTESDLLQDEEFF
jgi:hypothetical protein